MTTLSGIDLSSNNSGTQLSAARDFVIVRASTGLHTGDTEHDAFVARARAAKLLVGHYHFAVIEQDPEREADNFLAHADAVPGETLWLDLENGVKGTGTDNSGTTWQQRVKYALAWLDRVQAKTGTTPGWYANKTWHSGLLSAATPAQRTRFARYPLWIAAPSDPAGHPPVSLWTAHQYSDAGGIDRNVFAGTAAEWRKLGGATDPTPIPEDDDMGTPAENAEAFLDAEIPDDLHPGQSTTMRTLFKTLRRQVNGLAHVSATDLATAIVTALPAGSTDAAVIQSACEAALRNVLTEGVDGP